jgi:hypothetical protein
MNARRKGGDTHASRAAATADDVVDMLGDIEAEKVAAILAAEPTLEELEEAASWASDEGEALGKSGHPLSGKAAIVYEILVTEQNVGEDRE